MGSSGLPYQITPIVSRAIVLRDGGLKAMSKTVVPRDLLRPHDRDAFTIGDVEALDRFLASDMEAENCADDWQAYERFCDCLIKAVFRGLKCNDGFERVEGGYLKPADLKGDPARNIIALYDHLVERKPDVSLFKTFASKSSQELEVCLPPHDRFAARLGHPNPNHGRSLADSQRVALAHLLAAGHGEVVAVNGPPGTGKTTLLLSVVASLWAKAALEGGEPPIVLAASTNNQAVTNIIDAFGKGFARGEGPFARPLAARGVELRRLLSGRIPRERGTQEVSDASLLRSCGGPWLRGSRARRIPSSRVRRLSRPAWRPGHKGGGGASYEAEGASRHPRRAGDELGGARRGAGTGPRAPRT